MRRYSLLLALAVLVGTVKPAGARDTQMTDMQILNLLAYGGIGQFKVKIGGEPGGEDPNLDDSDWDVAFIGYTWDLPETNVWFRTTFVVPEKIGGFSLAGRDLTLDLNIDNGGEVYVNGKYLGSFEWDKGHFVIARNVQPGQRFVIAIRGINHPGYGKLYDAQMHISGMEAFQKKLQSSVLRLLLAKRLAQVFTDNPDYWYAQVDSVAARAVRSKAFQRGDEDAFIDELNRQMDVLRPLGDQLRAKYHIYAAGYAHIDLAWLWTWRETVQVVRNTSRSVLKIMKLFPDFHYTMTQAAAYRWMETYYPDLFEQIRQKVKEGRWEVAGGMWVEPDCNLPSGESFVRQVLYGKRYFLKKFGVDVKVCWIPDSFGYNWNLPQILARSGFEGFVTHKLNWNDTNKFPYRFFWWVAPDGSRVMSYIPESGYGHDLNPSDLINFSHHEEQQLGFGKVLVLYGVGDHGGGPTIRMLRRAKQEINSPAFLDVKLTTSKAFFDSITDSEKAKLPSWQTELYLEYHRGTYTSQARTKKHNREIEGLTLTAEKAAAFASLYGEPYPKRDFDVIWHTLLFNQFHDILPGSSINPVYHDTEIDYQQAQTLAQDILNTSLRRLARQIDTRGSGEALVVFNPLSWERTDRVAVPLGRLEKDRAWSVLAPDGTPVPTQIVDNSPTGATLLFIAHDVPPFGYKVYRLVQRRFSPAKTALEADRTHLANTFVEAELDPHTGLLTRLVHRPTGREVLAEPRGNLLQLLRNKAVDAWNLRFEGEPIDLDSATVVELVEAGPVRATIHVRHQFLGEQKNSKWPAENFPSSFFDQYVSVYADLPYLEVRNRVEWWEEHKMLKVAFPVTVRADSATFEIPYGTIQRSTGFSSSWEKARFEVPGHRWADLSSEGYGVSILNDSKYGWDIKGNVMRLSLLRSPTEPDPMADRGYQTFAYAVYPHQGDWRVAKTMRRGIEYNQHLVVFRAASHKGRLPNEHAFVQVSPDNVILNVIKRAEDNDAWILRFVETEGRSALVSVVLDRSLGQVQEVDLIERSTPGSVEKQSNGFRFQIRPHEIRTFKVLIRS